MLCIQRGEGVGQNWVYFVACIPYTVGLFFFFFFFSFLLLSINLWYFGSLASLQSAVLFAWTYFSCLSFPSWTIHG